MIGELRISRRDCGSMTEYDEAKRWHEDACREWKIVMRCWFWIVGDGAHARVHGDAYDADSRRGAAWDAFVNGWREDSLAALRDFNFRNPIGRFPYRRAKKKTTERNRGGAYDDSDSEDSDPDREVREKLKRWTPTPRPARQWEPRFEQTDEDRKVLLSAAWANDPSAVKRAPSRPVAVAEVIYADDDATVDRTHTPMRQEQAW